MNISNGIPCKDIYEERAAIMQFDGQMSRYIAELTAAKSQGFNSAVEIKVAFQTDDKGFCVCPQCQRLPQREPSRCS